MIYLTSNGLTENSLKTHVKKSVMGMKRAVIITTASAYKEDDYHIPAVRKWFEEMDFSVDLMDIEYEDVNLLCDYDLIYLLGGNPFYLLYFLNINEVQQLFKEHLKAGKILIGASAGSMVLTPSIELVQALDPQLNVFQMTDLKGLGLVEFEICPHKERFKDKYDAFKERLEAYTESLTYPLIPLKDGEAVFIHHKTITRLGA